MSADDWRQRRDADRRRRDDEDLGETIERAWRSRGLAVTVNAQLEIAKIKRGRGGES